MNTDGLFAFEKASAPFGYITSFKQIADRFVAGSINLATAVDEILIWFEKHRIPVNPHGDIDDWTSPKHFRSVLEDYLSMKSGERDASCRELTVLARFPAWRLVVNRETEADAQRNWSERWVAACQQVNWKGCLRGEDAIALKTSPVWQALGNGAGGYEDWLGNPFPPFAFSSGVGWEDVDIDECKKLGLSVGRIAPKGVSLAPDRADMERVIKQLGPKGMAALRKELKGLGLL